MNTITVNVDADGVALITIDLPGRSMNILTPQLTSDLAEAIEKIAGNAAVRGAVIASGKPKGFLAGADINGMLKIFEEGIDPVSASQLGEPMGAVFRRIETCGKPFAAAINGVALGGGLELALACHYRVLVDSPSAVVGLPEVSIGVLPGGGGTQRLPRLIGIEKALGPLLGGAPLRPAEALKLGIVDVVVPAEKLIHTAREWVLAHPAAVQPWDVKGFAIPGGAGPGASHAPRSFAAGATLLAQQTQRNNPAPIAILSAVYEGTQVPIDMGLRIERKYFGRLLSGPVARNLMRTMFINKQRADKLADRPAGISKLHVGKLGVLGAGMMGAGIAYAAANVGIEVVLLDSTEEKAERGKQYSRALLDKAIARGKSTAQKAEALLARIRPTSQYEGLATCDFVIEAVFESREIKSDVTRKAAAVMRPGAIYGSNTSTLPITGLAEAFDRPDDFIGVHFFSPVERMPLLEIIMGQKTSQKALAHALDLAEQLRKTPIVVNDSRGFFTSRTFGTFIKEGLAMLQEGVLPALIENAARQAGMPVGPLAVIDEVSLDIVVKVYDQWLADGVQPLHEPALSINLTRNMAEVQNRRGKAAGGGFYEYPAGAKKYLWPGLSELCPPAATQPDVQELKDRFLTIQALEAARCVEEGVIVSPGDADIGSILGIGFPAWTGGVLSYIETVGLQKFVDSAHRMATAYGKRYEPSGWLRERALEGRAFHPPMSTVHAA
jgi:3-hydroxyacyl-CoA dehydrogenase/enoyl-CoA hydratase/3-hydroxybutyryl-CoA epimerase